MSDGNGATDEWADVTAHFPLGYLFDNVPDWDEFCADVGLNPWLFNEGLALKTDTHGVKISVLRKHGILK